eukprot:scaffold119792_cov17-Prasinocladus_malaysianus.AAC.1
MGMGVRCNYMNIVLPICAHASSLAVDGKMHVIYRGICCYGVSVLPNSANVPGTKLLFICPIRSCVLKYN